MMVRQKTNNDARAAMPVETGEHPQVRSNGNVVEGLGRMSADHFQSLEKFESGLWKIADNLRAKEIAQLPTRTTGPVVDQPKQPTLL
jgi:hypothetical protein